MKGKHAFEHAHIFHSSTGQTHSSQGLPHHSPDSITWCIPTAIMTQSKFLLNAHIRRSEIMTHLFHRQILCVSSKVQNSLCGSTTEGNMPCHGAPLKRWSNSIYSSLAHHRDTFVLFIMLYQSVSQWNKTHKKNQSTSLYVRASFHGHVTISQSYQNLFRFNVHHILINSIQP